MTDIMRLSGDFAPYCQQIFEEKVVFPEPVSD